MASIYETFRPKELSDLCGFTDIVQRLEHLDEVLGFLGQAFWISGPSGSGKTTIARIIASRVAAEYASVEVDAQDVSIDTLRTWERDCQYKPLGSDGYAFIINEAHMLHTRSISRLQTLLEDGGIQRNSTWIFTTTTDGQMSLFGRQDALPFIGRCLYLELEPDQSTYEAMAMRACEIAVKTGLGNPSKESAMAKLRSCNGSMRMVLQTIASGELR